MISLPKWLRAHPENPEGRMAVMDHLRELRRRLIFCVLFVAAGAVVGWYFYPQILEFLKKPYCHVPVQYRYLAEGQPSDCALIYHGVLDGFTSRLKISVIAGVVVSAPFWLYQIWAFITPGLHRNERKYTLAFILVSTILFAAGMALAFVVLYKGIETVLRLAGAGTSALLTINDYISFVTLMLIVFGAAFELPLLVVMGNLGGALPASLLKKTQRIAVFLIFAFAAMATPSTDPFTMCAMAVPMVILYELAILFAHVHDKRKAARKEAERQAKQAADATRARPSAPADGDMPETTDDEAADLIPSLLDPVPRPLGDDRWSEIP